MRIMSDFLHFIHPIIIWNIKRIYFSWLFLTCCWSLSSSCCPWSWILWCGKFVGFLFIQKIRVEIFNFSFLLLIICTSIGCFWISCSIYIGFRLTLRIFTIHTSNLWPACSSHSNTLTSPQVVDHFFFILHFNLLVSICLLKTFAPIWTFYFFLIFYDSSLFGWYLNYVVILYFI